MLISNLIDSVIEQSIKNYDNNYQLGNPFEELIGFGQLVDRLSIINFKLYKLKDEVMLRLNDYKFTSWAAHEDIKLVIERARLKKRIDEKLTSTIKRIITTNDSGLNSEVKKYGDNKI